MRARTGRRPEKGADVAKGLITWCVVTVHEFVWNGPVRRIRVMTASGPLEFRKQPANPGPALCGSHVSLEAVKDEVKAKLELTLLLSL